MVGEQEVEEAVVHELIHAFDYSARRCDFNTCEGLAYTGDNENTPFFSTPLSIQH